ncbi:Cell division protein ZapD [Georgfuchsia toluolica]|uniref:Cell division protein ZapD n=1 Tax=Georgfuchsia toluolica TaxID=424218 RepID=A0A916J5Z3_9PROT|nr:cell division protein ZapD [Georgfuchsia toluolica]CAG4884567.1 Cell division protein ZapD [Georgfuchsia toluolica]
MITYEYPLNERIRTLLRLEDLFGKMDHFVSAPDPEDHHMALVTLFEILEVAGRADLKFDLMQELERQRQILLSFRNNPDISEDALSGALYEIEQAAAALLAIQGRLGQHLRDNEWLMAIKNRSVIPGGVCEFDLPSYHFWLHREISHRQRNLQHWTAPILAVNQAIAIVLRLLRASGRPENQVASHGAYQLMLAGRTAQMVRLRLGLADACVPEISASKYALNIRFLAAEVDQRPKQVNEDVRFELTFCNL